MDDDATMLGSGTMSASTSVANSVRLVSFNLSGTMHFGATSLRVIESQCGNTRLIDLLL